jgi:hypothetical protein
MLEYALENRRLADRHFGAVTKLLPEGGAMLRRLDGRGDVLLDEVGVKRLGEPLRIGLFVEFEVVGDPGSWRAHNPCGVNADARQARRLPVQETAE